MSTTQPTPTGEDTFLDRALPRIQRNLLVLAAVGLVIFLAWRDWAAAAGFFVGALVSYFNHRWMERAIQLLGDRIVNQSSKERGGVVVFRTLLRYILIAAGAYVIFGVSHAGLYGFLGGVCLPIAAIACEVAVEIFVILRHGS